MARVTGLEPATSGVTGRHSNRLSYTRAQTSTCQPCSSLGRWIRGSPPGVKRSGTASQQTGGGFLTSRTLAPKPAHSQAVACSFGLAKPALTA
jgi:hypothetical protein